MWKCRHHCLCCLEGIEFFYEIGKAWAERWAMVNSMIQIFLEFVLGINVFIIIATLIPLLNLSCLDKLKEFLTLNTWRNAAYTKKSDPAWPIRRLQKQCQTLSFENNRTIQFEPDPPARLAKGKPSSHGFSPNGFNPDWKTVCSAPQSLFNWVPVRLCLFT